VACQAARKARNAKEAGEGGDKQGKGAADNAKQWREQQLGKKLKAKQQQQLQQGQKQQQQQDSAQKRCALDICQHSAARVQLHLL
jgi:hypothetical protein